MFSHLATAQKVDCIVEAAQCFQINPLLIKAIIWQESRNRQQAVNRNTNSTVDIGIMQINTVHLKALKPLGINEALLQENSCANFFQVRGCSRKILNAMAIHGMQSVAIIQIRRCIMTGMSKKSFP